MYDEKCLELADHFLPAGGDLKELRAKLAQHIQDAANGCRQKSTRGLRRNMPTKTKPLSPKQTKEKLAYFIHPDAFEEVSRLPASMKPGMRREAMAAAERVYKELPKLGWIRGRTR